MKTTDAIVYDLTFSDRLVKSYLGDLTQDEMLTRAVEGSNHITWQVGHLLSSTYGLSQVATPGQLPELPAGFGEKYTKETADSDDVSDFHSKDELMALYDAQYAALVKATGELTDEQMAQPAPDNLVQLGKTAGEIAAFQPVHWLMHVGQWAIVRRKVGRAPLF